MKSMTVLVRKCHIVVALIVVGAAMLGSERTALAAVTFSTFVSTGDIAAAENGQTNTIGFTYAGDEFVGSLYFGTNNLQLYSTNLTGGNVQTFGAPLPTGSGEVVVGAALGGGFTKGDIYASSSGDLNIYHYSNNGSTQSLFASLPSSAIGVRQIFFDPGSSFGGNMLVTTFSGQIFEITSAGGAITTPLASTGEDTEGMDIAPSTWGPYAGQLLVSSEGSGELRFISPTGVVTLLTDSSGAPIIVPSAETVSFVPLNLGLSGNPLEGFYVANYPVNIQKAPASDFAGLQGDAIITSEDSFNARVWDLTFDSLTNSFSLDPTPIGNLPNQSEDGIFVTAQRLNDLNPVPEPATLIIWSLLGGLGIAVVHLRRRKAA